MRLLLAAIFCTLLAVVTASAQTYPAYNEIFVNDFADLLDESEEDRIREMLATLLEEEGVEFTVVTITSMADYGHVGPIEPFATGLFNHWGVGDATRNDGIMMLVAQEDRVMRIEVGAGYGTSKDVEMKEIIDEGIVPRFRRDDYAGGIIRGVRLVYRNMTGHFPADGAASFGQRIVEWLTMLFDRFGAWLYAFLVPVVGFPAQAYRRWRRNRPRICPEDGSRMQRLDEDWDDMHLQQGQLTEESLKSVDYDVWQCPICDHVTVEGYRAWFSRFGACGVCGFRTLEGKTTILQSATTSSTGKKRIDYNCHYCGNAYSITKTIPRKSESSSSGGGRGRSSFGGGRSSGGGASGGW